MDSRKIDYISDPHIDFWARGQLVMQALSDTAQFGAKTIEYDIIHVCRKRTEEPSEISWPKLRRQILRDVRQLQNLLEYHQQAGLPEADIEVIKRGKALEYFSRHYGDSGRFVP